MHSGGITIVIQRHREIEITYPKEHREIQHENINPETVSSEYTCGKLVYTDGLTERIDRQYRFKADSKPCSHPPVHHFYTGSTRLEALSIYTCAWHTDEAASKLKEVLQG